MTDCANLPNGASFCLSVGVYLKQHTHTNKHPPPNTLPHVGLLESRVAPVESFPGPGCISSVRPAVSPSPSLL